MEVCWTAELSSYPYLTTLSKLTKVLGLVSRQSNRDSVLSLE